ncbi:MAG: beta-lactamase family protein [Undibacterium sp.]|nr:beta-lactamase family protein [Opitutaceae bacterium]
MTLFNIASVAKPISAVVALRLVELGQLDLDRPLREFDGYSEYRTTVRAEGGLFFHNFDDDQKIPLTLRQLLSMQANGTPGTRFFYNAPAFSWTSRPMAQVAKTPFSEFTARHVFNPAGMAHSARIHRKLPLAASFAAHLAKPYHLAPDGGFALSDPPPRQATAPPAASSPQRWISPASTAPSRRANSSRPPRSPGCGPRAAHPTAKHYPTVSAGASKNFAVKNFSGTPGSGKAPPPRSA